MWSVSQWQLFFLNSTWQNSSPETLHWFMFLIILIILIIITDLPLARKWCLDFFRPNLGLQTRLQTAVQESMGHSSKYKSDSDPGCRRVHAAQPWCPRFPPWNFTPRLFFPSLKTLGTCTTTFFRYLNWQNSCVSAWNNFRILMTVILKIVFLLSWRTVRVSKQSSNLLKYQADVRVLQ